jgi:DNA-binding transcriptional LysR family regulator
MDRIGKMTAFTKVVETGSFIGAAQQMRVSSTIISKHVRELEAWLGVRLLNRTTRHVSLTEIGTVFYERCRELLVELAELENVAGKLQTTPRGTLRVSAPLAFGAARIAAVLPDFAQACPQVTVELILTDRYVDVVEEGFDLAVTMDELPDSSVITRLLGTTQTILCAAPAYLARHPAPNVPDDLLGHNCLTHATQALARAWVFTGGADRVAHRVKVSGNFRTNSAAAQLTAALQGLGVALQPDFLVAQALREGSLVALLQGYAAPNLPIRLVYPPGRYLAAKVRAFADFLVSRFAA